MISRKLIFTALIFLVSPVFALTEGELLFTQNKTKEAIPLLEADIRSGKGSGDTYNYLGLAYFQTGDYEQSVRVFEDAMKVPASNKKVVSFNQGNSYYALTNYENAVKCYSYSISIDKNYANAYLNRANAYLMLKKYTESVADYTAYLKMAPKDPQRNKIKQLIALLTAEIKKLEEEAAQNALAQKQLEEAYSDDLDEFAGKKSDEGMYQDDFIAAEDNKDENNEENLTAADREMLMEDAAILEEGRLAEEKRLQALRDAEAARKAEEEHLAEQRKLSDAELENQRRQEEFRQTEERLLQYETERRRKMLEEVANSLNTESVNMTSGSEEIIETEKEPELE